MLFVLILIDRRLESAQFCFNVVGKGPDKLLGDLPVRWCRFLGPKPRFLEMCKVGVKLV